jgi:hypothetical protein
VPLAHEADWPVFNTGTFSDLGADTVTLTSSIGTVVDNGNGTWSWSWNTSEGPDDSQTVTITATESNGAATQTTFALTVNNVAPTATIAGPTSTVRGFKTLFTLGAVDPSPVDQAAEFTYAIDWESDGIIDQVETGPSGHSVPVAFRLNGTRVVSVTATDVDGGVSEVATHAIEVKSAEEVDRKVKIGMPVDKATLKVSQGSVIVTFLDLDGNVLERLTFDDQDVNGIIVQGQEADDEIIVDPLIKLPVEVFAGAGNDVIQGGGGTNILHGEEGSDTIISGPGTNTLDGGEGDDTFIDTGGTNTIVGGAGSNTFVPGGGINDFETDVDNPVPTVFADTYGVAEGGILSVSVNDGVLANDIQPTADPLQAIVVSGPSHGTLAFSSDGSFTYTHDGSNNPDSFTYVASIPGGESSPATVTIAVGNLAPFVGMIAAPIDPQSVDNSVLASATFADAGLSDMHTAEWDWGDGTTSTGTVTQGSGAGSVSGTHTYTAAGVYTIALTVTDSDSDGAATSIFQYAVIYDPSAGFVTGGGWIDSPAGAFLADPGLTGQASFGFVSRYKKGKSVPRGNTAFRFNAGDLAFRSIVYDWLVVSGAKAQYKGKGKINGEGNYGFRIKIWDKTGGVDGEVIYDNQLGTADDSYDGTVLGGGSIVIHGNNGGPRSDAAFGSVIDENTDALTHEFNGSTGSVSTPCDPGNLDTDPPA